MATTQTHAVNPISAARVPFEDDRAAAARWAAGVLAEDNWAILDTETTGLGPGAEIIQIAVLGPEDLLLGAVLMDRLVKPRLPIPPEATEVHGITNAMVLAAPPFADVYTELVGCLAGRRLIIYNAGYDWPIIQRECVRAGLPEPHPASIECAMLWYAQFVGEWDRRHGNFRWQRLPAAKGAHAHSALGDCESTLQVLREMAWEVEVEVGDV